MHMPRPRKRNLCILKRLQTELQALIAFGCYDSDFVLKCGKSAKKSTFIAKLHKPYIPSNDRDGRHVSQIELLLEGKIKYKHLFEEKHIAANYSTNNHTGVSQSSASKNNGNPNVDNPPLLILSEIFHFLDGKEILVKNDCIDKALLTRRNLTNFVDIQPGILF